MSWEVVGKCVQYGMKNRRSGGKVLAGVAALYLSKLLYSAYRLRKTRQKITEKQKTLKERKLNLKKSLMVEGELLTLQRRAILDLEIEDLLAELRQDTLDPLDVLQAFQAKSLVVDVHINAVCDYILEAKGWAESLKNIPKHERGPLFGLPISVKECFFVKGYDATIGLAGLIGKPAEEDCDFIKFIKDMHGIPFCLTNIPQTMVSFSCSNPIYGNTNNPHDLTRTPGGSSGGEGALIAAGGSVLGIGSDIGGSLRIPAHFSGVVGLKPTTDRIYQGGRRGGQGSGSKALRPCITSVAGFMSSSVQGIRVGMKVLLENARRMSLDDWRVVPLHWQESLYTPTRKLRIGWYDHDGFFPVTPGCKRAVKMVVEKLEADGHTVVEWSGRDHSEMFGVFLQTILSDLGYHSLQTWKHEILDQAIEASVFSFKTPTRLRIVFTILFSFLSSKMKMLWNSPRPQTKDLWVTNATRDRLIDAFINDWAKQDFDIVICPGFPYPAVHPTYPARTLPATSYTAVYNTIGNPVGMLPVTRETEEDQAELSNYKVYDDLMHRLARNATRGATGCPIGVQVVGRHFQEELVIHAMETIQNLVNYDATVNL